ncbi:hypothetical protein [Pelomonas sp. SE-A7]|uniref:hypothetical protein n=1 Tax=Pelomonas sp. SE-A7 TaxID=3054953 RepID=UPI00259CFFC8|nr:hypothetical protein [Pelomonas sp. SE-A7]MDM4767012.1 hypothetical protein [Pelomonas sp. SE-A7]
MPRLHHPPLFLLLPLLISACSAAPPPSASEARSLHAQLKAEIGEAVCDSDAQCRSLAVGHKACGGPAGYLAWSSKQGSEARIKDLAQRQAAAEKAEAQRSGMVSDCAVVADPGAYCKPGKPSRCELRSSAARGAELIR